MRLLLLKSQGQKFAGQAGYYFQQGRWHKFGGDKAAPKHVPVSSHPEAAGKFTPKQHFTDEQWEGLKLPESNVNAKTVNKKIDELKHYSDTGNVSAILGMSIGSNNYGKQVAIIANKLLDMYGVAHKVSHGQKAGTHPAVAHKGDTASLTNEPAKAEEKPKATTKPAAKPAADADKAGEPKKPSFQKEHFIGMWGLTPSNQDHDGYATAIWQKDNGEKVSLINDTKKGKIYVGYNDGQRGFNSGYQLVDTVDQAIAALPKLTQGGFKDIPSAVKSEFESYVADAKKAAGGQADKPKPAAQDAGPKDGDTKQGADGTLVFKDGHWHKQAAPAKAEKPKAKTKPAPTASNPPVNKPVMLDNSAAKGEIGMMSDDLEGGAKSEVEDALMQPSTNKAAIYNSLGALEAAASFNHAGDTVKVTHIGSVGFKKGTKLIDFIKDFAAKNKATTIKLDSSNSAVGFYKKMGFTAPDPKKPNAMVFNVGGETKEPPAPKAEPEKQAAGITTTLHNTEPGHNKSWSVNVKGKTVTTEYGKIGAKQTQTVKEFASAAEAANHASKLISQKKAKGYKVVKDATPAPTPAKPAAKKEAVKTKDAKPKDPQVSGGVLKHLSGMITDAGETGDKDAINYAIGSAKNHFNSPETQDVIKYGEEMLAYLNNKPAASKTEDGPQEGQTKPGANGGTLVFHDGHWHKQDDGAGDNQDTKSMLDAIGFDKDKLPESNSNAKTHNGAIDKIKAMAYGGDLAGLKAFHAKKSQAKQNYALKQAKLAAVAIAALEEGGSKPAISEADLKAAKMPADSEWPVVANAKGNTYVSGKVGDTIVALGYIKEDGHIMVGIGNQTGKPASTLAQALGMIAGALDEDPNAKLPSIDVLNEFAEKSGGKVSPISATAYNLINDSFKDSVAKATGKPAKVGSLGNGWGLFAQGKHSTEADVAKIYSMEKVFDGGAKANISLDTEAGKATVTLIDADGKSESTKVNGLFTAADMIGEFSAKLSGGKGEVPSMSALNAFASLTGDKLMPINNTKYNAIKDALATHNATHNNASGSEPGSSDGKPQQPPRESAINTKTASPKLMTSVWDVDARDEGLDGAKSIKTTIGDVFVYVGYTKQDGYQIGTMDFATEDFEADGAATSSEALKWLAEKCVFLGAEPPPYEVMKKYAGILGQPAYKESAWNQIVADAKAKFAVEPEDDGPHDGDTKQGADGMLVFENGRWHKMGEKAQPAPSGPADVAIPSFTSNNPKHIEIATKAAQLLKDKVVAEGKAGFKGLLVNHKDGSVSFKNGTTKITHAKVGSSLPVLDEFAQFVDALKAAVSGKASKAKPDAAGPKEPPEPEDGSPVSMDHWTQIGGQLGSNAGGKFKDQSGQEWYCKFPENEHVAKSEVLASKLYALAGIAGQDAKLITKNGKIGIASKWMDVTKSTAAKLAQNKSVLEGFAVDAWLANWDVIGMDLDNLQVGSDGKAIRVDAGGSLGYRAQGGKKEFGDHVPEIDTLRDPAVNPKAAAVFGNMTTADITASVAKVLKVSDSAITEMVNSFGPGSEAEKSAMIKTLIARKDALAKKYPKAAAKVKKYLDPHALPIDPERLPKRHDFENFNGPGSPLSSKEHVNKANNAVEQQMWKLAASGDMVALKDFKYQPIDKETGEPVGELKPISEYPSKHVVQFHQDLMQIMDEVANPPEPLKVFKDQDFSSLETLSKAFAPKKFGTTVASVSSNEKLGFWVALGVAHNAAKSLAPKKTRNLSQDEIKQAYTNFKNMTPLAKHFVKSVQASGSYNDLFRDGKQKDFSGNKLSDVAKAALGAAVEHEEGTSIYRWQNMSDAMVKHILSTQDGTVFQATGPMCTSYSPTATSGFGKHRVTIRYAKGAKAVESFGSGGYQSEKEITTLPNARFLILSKKMVHDDIKGGKDRLELEVLMLPPDLGL